MDIAAGNFLKLMLSDSTGRVFESIRFELKQGLRHEEELQMRLDRSYLYGLEVQAVTAEDAPLESPITLGNNRYISP